MSAVRVSTSVLRDLEQKAEKVPWLNSEIDALKAEVATLKAEKDEARNVARRLNEENKVLKKTETAWIEFHDLEVKRWVREDEKFANLEKELAREFDRNVALEQEVENLKSKVHDLEVYYEKLIKQNGLLRLALVDIEQLAIGKLGRVVNPTDMSDIAQKARRAREAQSSV